MKTKKIHPFVRVLQRELDRIRQRKTLWFTTFLGPLFGFFLVAYIFSGSVPRKFPVAVVDLDHTNLSRQMTRMVNSTPIASVSSNYTDLALARKAIEDGKIDAVVFIPDGTEKEILRGKSGSVALYLNNANVLKGGLLNSGIRKALSTLSAGIKLQVQMKNGLTQDQAMSQIMPVQLRQVLLFNPYTSYSYYLTAGLLPVILVVFTLLGTLYAMGDELYRGTGKSWIKTADGNFAWALTGKLLPYTIIYFFQAMVLNLILFCFLGMPLRGNYHIILVSELLLILSYQSFAIMLLALTSNMRLSLSLGSAYSMLALTYSGLTFPIIGMSHLGQIIAGAFPFTYWLKILVSQSLRGEPAANGIWPMFSLWIFILLGFLFIPLLKYMLLNKKRWGKI
ncbi:MAG TPA: ABC transporter permease [Bacteroidales bacterium]